MPLFTARIRVSKIEEVPIEAASLQEAERWMRRHPRDWRKDGQLESYPTGTQIRFVDCARITTPEESPFEGDCLCWGESMQWDTMTVSRVFYAEEMDRAKPPDGLEETEETEAQWEAYFELEREYEVKFDRLQAQGERERREV